MTMATFIGRCPHCGRGEDPQLTFTEDVPKRFKEILEIANGLGHEFKREEISLSQKLDDDLGWDSLDVAEMVMALEDAYSTEIPDDVVESWRTIGDIAECIAVRELSLTNSWRVGCTNEEAEKEDS